MVDAKTNDGVVTGVQSLLGLLAKSRFAERQKAHVRLWFRGQPVSSWGLTPGVYRPTLPAVDEAARLNTERHLTQDFRVQSAGLLVKSREDSELCFLQ